MKRCRSAAGAAAAEATQLSSTNTTTIAATTKTTVARKNAQWGRHTGHSMRLPAHPIL